MIKTVILLAKKPANNKVLIFTCLFILIILICSFYIKTYDSISLTGIASCQKKCTIEVNISSDKADILNKKPLIMYDNKKYKIKEMKVEDILIENDMPYSKIKIISDLSLQKSNFINFKMIYNKQRIIEKIIKNIKGKD